MNMAGPTFRVVLSPRPLFLRGGALLVIAIACLSSLAAQEQTTAVRAGRLFDAKTGTMLTNQVVLIRGERIADVGANVTVPAGARVIDLSTSTVLPGMI